MTLPTLPDKIERWAKATVTVGALIGGIYVMTSQAVTTIKAGPDALVKATKLEKKMKRLDHRTRYIVRGISKLTNERYSYQEEERAAEQEGDEE